MFKYFRLKKQLLEDQAYLVHKVREYVDRFPDIVALIDKVKNVDGSEFEKLIVEELVKYAKNNGQLPND